MIFKWILGSTWDCAMDSSCCRIQRQAVVSTEITFVFLKRRVIPWLSEYPLGSQERLCSTLWFLTDTPVKVFVLPTSGIRARVSLKKLYSLFPKYRVIFFLNLFLPVEGCLDRAFFIKVYLCRGRNLLTFVWWVCFVHVHIKVLQGTLIHALFSEKPPMLTWKVNVRFLWRVRRLMNKGGLTWHLVHSGRNTAMSGRLKDEPDKFPFQNGISNYCNIDYISSFSVK
jgi:hypothetical protein